VWQQLHAEFESAGVTVVTIGLDSDPSLAYPWIDAANPTHPSLIDRAHITGGILGFTNIPMAIWVDENGVIVRPAEAASVQPNTLKGNPLPEGLPPRITARLEIVQQFDDTHESYLEALRDWVANGVKSRYALTPEEVIERSQPRGVDESRGAACFELGNAIRERSGLEAASGWWREAHRLDPTNWTYRRQAWSLATTKEGEPSDLIQEPTDLFEGNWLDDVLAGGGAQAYTRAFSGA
jgi:hypothetical protein